jgi:hypothetical protein
MNLVKQSEDKRSADEKMHKKKKNGQLLYEQEELSHLYDALGNEK